MTVQLFNGLWLFIDGLLATDPACCCGVCCGPNCEVAWGVDFEPDPGMSESFTDFLEGRGYSNIEYSLDALTGTALWSADCCKSDADNTDTFTVTGSGGSTVLTVPFCISAKQPSGDCAEGLTPAECEALSGSPVSAASCSPSPCACPAGGPGLGTLNPDFCGGYDFCCTENGCVEAGYFAADAGDCVCYTGESPGGPGVYATYAECCAENFCPDPPP